MHHEQRPAQLADALGQVLLGGILQELALDAKGPTGQLHVSLPLVVDLVQVVVKEPNDMRGSLGAPIVTTARDVGGSGQDGGAAEAVADQQLRRPVRCRSRRRGSGSPSPHAGAPAVVDDPKPAFANVGNGAARNEHGLQRY